MRGACAKKMVKCVIVPTRGGEAVVGENWCANPQTECPREEGEGYEKCKTICGQMYHAEEDAIRLAGANAVGARAYLYGHTYYCRNCQEALFAAGVESLHVPKEN